MGASRARMRTTAVLVLGAVALVVALGVQTASAAPAYDFEARDSTAISGRVFGAAATAPDDDGVVLYGGSVPGQTGDSLADTWVYTDAAGWAPKCGTAVADATAACPPGPRSAGAMAQGPTGAVLFGGGPQGIDGGGGGGPLPSDTWVWTGGAWQQACASGACGPDGRFFPALGGNGEQVVMFGGIGGSGAFDDTWVFDGSTWTQTCGTGAAVGCGVPGLAAATIGWDGTQFVMFGGTPFGETEGVPPVDDTWTFDGTKWTQVCGTSISQPCGPEARSLASAAFQKAADPSNQGIVMGGGGNLFGGSEQSLQRSVWFWHAGAWSPLPTPWDDSAVSWTEGEAQPPVGSGPLIPMFVARPSSCQILAVGQNPVDRGAGFTLESQTFAGGWDLDASGAPSGCTATPEGDPTGAPAAGTGDGGAAPASSPLPATDGTGSTGSIARTGATSDRLALVGATSVLLGLVAVRAGRPRVVGRARTATR